MPLIIIAEKEMPVSRRLKIKMCVLIIESIGIG
jgi:hypothetical protein